MPRLVQINTCANIGSTGRIAEQINNIAQKHGWETYIAYGRSALMGKSKLIHVGGIISQAIALLSSRCFDNEGLSNRIATRQLIRTLKKLKPDIIHLHNLHGYYINYRILFEYLYSANVPIVWTLHDCWTFTGHCCYFSMAGCEKWQVQCDNCPQKMSYPASFWMDKSFENYKKKELLFTSNPKIHLVAVSQWLASMLKLSFFQSMSIRYIYNGVDTELFSPRSSDNVRSKYNIKTAQYVIGVASSWTERKGINDYVKLSTRLSDDMGIVLVGVTDKQVKYLQKSGIVGIPRTNSIDELVELYSGAEVVLNLSVEETFGLTTVEGFACGVPSIVYNCTASPELVTNETGIVVEPGHIDEIVLAIQAILAKGKQSYSEACRDRAVHYFNKEDRYNEYFELYESLLKDKKVE